MSVLQPAAHQAKAKHTSSAMPPAISQHSSGPTHCAHGMARQVPVLHPAAHQAKAKHILSAMPRPLHLNITDNCAPKHCQLKTSARAATQSLHVKAKHSSSAMPPSASQHASRPQHCPWQGKRPCCIPQHTKVEANNTHPVRCHTRCISTCQRTTTLPSKIMLVLHPAAHQANPKHAH